MHFLYINFFSCQNEQLEKWAISWPFKHLYITGLWHKWSCEIILIMNATILTGEESSKNTHSHKLNPISVNVTCRQTFHHALTLSYFFAIICCHNCYCCCFLCMDFVHKGWIKYWNEERERERKETIASKSELRHYQSGSVLNSVIDKLSGIQMEGIDLICNESNYVCVCVFLPSSKTRSSLEILRHFLLTNR